MKHRTSFYVGIGLLILFIASLAWSVLSARNRTPARLFDATANRDCAPWDGAAFSVSIRYDLISVIDVSIWQAPEISLPVTFEFPDSSGRAGNAVYRPQFSPPEQLAGMVSFWRVGQDRPVEGGFDLVRGDGMHLRGKFRAEWGNQRALCG